MQQLVVPPWVDPATEFLTSRIDYERTLTIPYGQQDFRLDRMRQLLDRLGNPHDRLNVIHVAGTKGKGSTSAMISSVLSAGGHRPGLFSSPHLDHVSERIAVDGASCPLDDLIRLVDTIRPAVAELDAMPSDDPRVSNRPTYFEIITALALMRFAECQVDAAVLEVGLGGRLDSTNVCQPRVSVITSISFDHTQQLGNTLAAIAAEKAGIIKPGVPVVSGVLADEPRRVIADVAHAHGCRLSQLGRDFDFVYRPPQRLDAASAGGRLDYLSTSVSTGPSLADVELSLAGAHQAANAAVALATLDELRRAGWNVPQSAVRRGLSRVCWPARIEVIGRSPTIVLDAAHNVASMEALVRVLDESFSRSPRLALFATARDKDAAGMLRVLGGAFDEIVFTRYGSNPRSTPPEELARMAAELDISRAHVAADASQAWSLAQRLAGANHLVCITGSFFIAAEMRALVRDATR